MIQVIFYPTLYIIDLHFSNHSCNNIVIAFSSDNHVNQQFTVFFLHWHNIILLYKGSHNYPFPHLNFWSTQNYCMRIDTYCWNELEYYINLT